MHGIFCFGRGRAVDHCRAVVVALLTVSIGSAALGQGNTRVTRYDGSIDNLNRLLNDPGMPGSSPSLRNQTFLNAPPQVDLTKIDQRVLSNLMKEAVDESTRLYRLLDTDYQRNPQLRPLVQQYNHLATKSPAVCGLTLLTLRI